MSTDDSIPKTKPAPFASLLAISSLLAALFLVAGFSYRWSYYYNFGLKDLALQISLQSVAISAMELIRTPGSALTTLLIVALPLAAFNVLVTAIRAIASRPRFRPVVALGSSIGLSAPLFSDLARALLLFYSSYWAGSEAGYQKFMQHIVEGPDNTLPEVSVVSTGSGSKGASAFECGKTDWAHPGGSTEAVGDSAHTTLGSPSALQAMAEGKACNVTGQRTWRLLYREDKYSYIFATGSVAQRPLTVVLPNTDNQILLLGASK